MKFHVQKQASFNIGETLLETDMQTSSFTTHKPDLLCMFPDEENCNFTRF